MMRRGSGVGGREGREGRGGGLEGETETCEFFFYD